MRSLLSFAIALACLIALPSQAEIYKTTDKNGHTVYTDLPPANSNAKILDQHPINTVPKTESNGAYTQNNQQAANELHYQINIALPTPNTQLTPEIRSLAVSITTDQPLADDLFFAYMIDGQVALESRDMSVTLDEPPRGEHSLSVAVRNQDGQEFGKSESVTFIVFRPILKQKAENVPSKK